MLFRSLSYFRDYEDESVRKDKNEGTSVYRPSEGLFITNQTKGTTFTLPGYAFESAANPEEVFVFCASRSLNDELRARFEAVACVEISKVRTFCERIKRALPANASFRAGRVDYYDDGEGPGARWALPDQIAMSKFKSYEWQREFRLLFCLTDALTFEKGATRLVKGEVKAQIAEHRQYPVNAGSLQDICRVHEFVRAVQSSS